MNVIFISFLFVSAFISEAILVDAPSYILFSYRYINNHNISSLVLFVIHSDSTCDINFYTDIHSIVQTFLADIRHWLTEPKLFFHSSLQVLFSVPILVFVPPVLDAINFLYIKWYNLYFVCMNWFHQLRCFIDVDFKISENFNAWLAMRIC